MSERRRVSCCPVAADNAGNISCFHPKMKAKKCSPHFYAGLNNGHKTSVGASCAGIIRGSAFLGRCVELMFPETLKKLLNRMLRQ